MVSLGMSSLLTDFALHTKTHRPPPRLPCKPYTKCAHPAHMHVCPPSPPPCSPPTCADVISFFAVFFWCVTAWTLLCAHWPILLDTFISAPWAAGPTEAWPPLPDEAAEGMQRAGEAGAAWRGEGNGGGGGGQGSLEVLVTSQRCLHMRSRNTQVAS